MDLQMRGIVIGFALLGCVNVAYCINYTDYTLPSTITLNGNRSDTITSSKGNGQATTIGYNRNPHLTINGRANSQYVLQVSDNTTTFYSGGFSVASGIQSAIMSAHTLAIQSGSVSVGNGATFNVISSGTTINPQGSEYGGESKVRFSRGSSLQLAQNATADFSNANFFIHDGIVNLSQNATLRVSANTIRFQNSLTNNGGSANLTGSVYNVGGTVGVLSNNTTSNFTINSGGRVVVNGNFYNGLESKDMSVDTTGSVAGGFNAFDAVFGGGGNLIINGGNLSITGTLISRQGGTSINGGGIYDSKNSSISIYGGTLTATGGVQNLAGSTLTIGADNSGKMGQIIGSVANSGTYIVDAKGAVAGNHTLITGTLTGGGSVRLINGNSDFANANLNGTTLSVTINQAQINHFKTTLNNNESATLTRFGDDIYTISGASSANLKTSANDINRAIFSAFYATNLAVMESLTFDSDLIFSKQRSTKRVVNPRQARQVRKISTKGANPNNINAGFIVQGISGDANGILGGIRAGYGVDFVRGRFALNFAYAYGNLKNALDTFIATQNLATKSHNLTLGANLNARFAGNFGVDLGLSGFMIFANHTREIKSNRQISSLKSSQNIYQITVDLAFVYDFKITNFMIAPYLGLNQGFLAMPKFAEAGGDFALNAEAYYSYFLSAILGAKVGFDFRNYGAILGKIDYKFLAYNSQKTHILHYVNSTDSLIFKIPNAHKIAFDLGYQKDFGAWYLRVNGNFGAIFNVSKAKDASVNFYDYGIQGAFGYIF